MSKIILTILTLWAALFAFAQGKTADGLRTGFWTEKFQGAGNNYTLKGSYKIIPLATYDSIRALGSNCYEVRYKGSTPLLFFHRRVKDKISVKDSIWNHYDKNGNLRKVDFWIEGLNQWAKYYDEQGQLTQYDYRDYINDTSFEFTYYNGRLFKKAFYPPGNKNQQTKIYYPNAPLTVSDAELSFTINFLDKKTAIKTITISAKKDIIIRSFDSKRSFVKITDANEKPVRFPLTIMANSSVPINIIVSPTSANYQMTDTLTLATLESENPYKIYTDIYAHHINGRTVDTLSSIQLSKTKDKFLILPSMGTVTGATIVSKSGGSFFYEIHRITKIDLATFPAGTYRLLIESCNTGGEMEFVITE